MKLKRIRIHNFRSILEADLKCEGYTLLVGANNSGKSTVLAALRAFYEKDKFSYKRNRDFPFSGASDKESWVELTFNITAEESESLKEDYRRDDHILTLRKYFETSEKQEDGKTSRAGYIHACQPDGTIAAESFYGAKNVQSGKIGDLIFIPAVSKVDEYTKLSGPSALRDLITEILASVAESSESYELFGQQFDNFAGKIRTEPRADGKSLRTFEDDFNKLLNGWGTDFSLIMDPPSAAEIIKNMVRLVWKDSRFDEELEIDSIGSGFHRHFIYSLIRIRADYAPLKTPAKKKDFTPELTLLLFEEPEAFLHPPQQESLSRSLRKLGAEPYSQALCSTHSPYFVSHEVGDILGIVRTRSTRTCSEVHQLSQEVWDSIIDSNQVVNLIAAKYSELKKRLSSDDCAPEMEALKYFLWLNPDRSGIFFAEHVLLVEGASEVALIRRLTDEGALDFGGRGVHLLDCLGKFNIHRFMNLLSALCIPHSVIHEDDGDTGYHAELNSLIRETAASSQYTRALVVIPGTLEDLLGVEKAGAEHRKPQHILYSHSTGKIDEKGLARFCEIVESAVSVVSIAHEVRDG